VGTYESWRPDAKKFLEVDDLVRDKMDEWDENYLDISNPYVLIFYNIYIFINLAKILYEN